MWYAKNIEESVRPLITEYRIKQKIAPPTDIFLIVAEKIHTTASSATAKIINPIAPLPQIRLKIAGETAAA